VRTPASLREWGGMGTVHTGMGGDDNRTLFLCSTLIKMDVGKLAVTKLC